jgi:8-oxo-dGTP pyrophosphatase MutT (NUDIX family)
MSAGGVVVRNGERGPEVAMIRTTNRRGSTVWGLPKGAPEPAEQPATTALREVREETGLEAEVVAELEPITYWFAWEPEEVRYRKTVHFFLMRATGGSPEDHDDEVEEVSFFPLDEAPRQASYPSEAKILRSAAEVVRSW